ncbi:biopolymer transporter ExbD, partial [Vibrio parahaemolyticus]|uniref:biopolymer transporter ExbD n=1 Tax=Vibrio parahaemolyticus TaxID=670 RepID=UPI0011704876
TSLMDIFTVLVFFLIFNIHDSSVNIIEGARERDIPESIVSLDELKNNANFSLLEILKNGDVFFNGIEVTSNEDLSLKVEEYCSSFKDKCTNTKLAVFADKEMNYLGIDGYLKSLQGSEFENVYLMVRKNL